MILIQYEFIEDIFGTPPWKTYSKILPNWREVKKWLRKTDIDTIKIVRIKRIKIKYTDWPYNDKAIVEIMYL